MGYLFKQRALLIKRTNISLSLVNKTRVKFQSVFCFIILLLSMVSVNSYQMLILSSLESLNYIFSISPVKIIQVILSICICFANNWVKSDNVLFINK